MLEHAQLGGKNAFSFRLIQEAIVGTSTVHYPLCKQCSSLAFGLIILVKLACIQEVSYFVASATFVTTYIPSVAGG